MIITLTLTKINGQTQGTLSRGFNTSWITNLRPTTEGNLSSAARFEYGENASLLQTIDVSDTYSATLSAIQSADREAGAELLANKDASGGYAGLTLLKINFKNVLGTFTSFFTNSNTAARTYTFPDETGTLITNQSKDATGGYAGLTLFKINFKNAANTFTSFFTNTNTAARTYTFQDRDGTIADDTDLGLKISTSAKDATGGVAGLTLFKVNLKNDANTFTSTLANTNTASRAYTLPDVAGGILVGAKIPTTALTAGVLAATVTGASTTSTAVVMTVALGGTVAAGGYKVACTANTVTITALQADGTTTETGCTSTVQGICIL